jgi:hypothetical protein
MWRGPDHPFGPRLTTSPTAGMILSAPKRV